MTPLCVRGWCSGYLGIIKAAYGTGYGPQVSATLGPSQQQNQAYIPNMNNALLGQMADLSRTAAGGIVGGTQMYPGAPPVPAGEEPVNKTQAWQSFTPTRGVK